MKTIHFEDNLEGSRRLRWPYFPNPITADKMSMINKNLTLIASSPVREIGDKYKCLGFDLTVKCFISSDGLQYATLLDCAQKNPGKNINVINQEFGGINPLELINPI